MSMTIEEAIRHFEDHAKCNYTPTREAAKMAVAALRAQQVPNQPLTLEELLEMDGPVWCRVDDICWIPEGGFWCLCKRGKLITPALIQYECENLDLNLWRFYRRKPEGML